MNYYEERPWGSFEILEEDTYCKVKRLLIKHGEQTSYQYHVNRNETWTIVKGFAEITLNGKMQNAGPGFAITVPKLMKHRIKNRGSVDLVIIEVQHGDSFEEEDIVRIEDSYGRI